MEEKKKKKKDQKRIRGVFFAPMYGTGDGTSPAEIGPMDVAGLGSITATPQMSSFDHEVLEIENAMRLAEEFGQVQRWNQYAEAEYQGRDVDLNKPSRGDRKKYKVFVRDPKTKKVKKVEFGDPNMEIKRDDPDRRRAFRARHNCDQAKDKTTPRYWSCRFWDRDSVSDLLGKD